MFYVRTLSHLFGNVTAVLEFLLILSFRIYIFIMHRFFICLIAAITIVIPSFSQNIVLHAPDHFDGPVRDGIRMFLDSLVYDSHVEEIHIPDIMTIGSIIRKSKFSPNPKRSVHFSSVHSKRNVQKKGLAHNTNNKARNKSQNHSISGFGKHNSTGNIIAFK